MPEGDVVWLAARRLHAGLAGERLTATDFRLPALATVDLTGRQVVEVAARGKHLLIRVDDGRTLHTHYRMQGAWHLYSPGRRWTGGPMHEIRVVLRTATNVAVGYRLPVVQLLPTVDEAAVVGHLGPDLLGADWDEAEALRRLGRDPEREIGPALLDQRNLAGIGNLYKTETLFLTGVSPWTPVREVADLPRVVRTARRLMTANRNGWAQVTTGHSAPGRQHWVFERAARSCRRCGTAVASADQGDPPRARRSYWCPTCQPRPSGGSGR